MGLFDRWTKSEAPAPETMDPEAANEGVAEAAPKLEVVKPAPDAENAQSKRVVGDIEREKELGTKIAESERLIELETELAELTSQETLPTLPSEGKDLSFDQRMENLNKNMARDRRLEAVNKEVTILNARVGEFKNNYDKSPDYQAWLIAGVQVDASIRMQQKSEKLEAYTFQLSELEAQEELPVLASEGGDLSFDQRQENLTKNMERTKGIKKLQEEIDILNQLVNFEEEAYEEREIDLARLQIEMKGGLNVEEQKVYEKASAANAKLIAAEDALADLKSGFRTKLKAFFGFGKTKAIKDAEAAVSAAEKEIAAIDIDSVISSSKPGQAATMRAKYNSRKSA